MCDPVTIATVAAVATPLIEGYSAKQQGAYQNDIERYNARQLENEAIRTRNRGVEDENEHRRATAELISRQRVQSAANNVEITLGSAAQIQEDSAVLGEVDALRIRRGFEDQAQSLDDQSDLAIARGEAAERSGNFAFATSLIGAAGAAANSGVADKWFTPESAANSATINNGQNFAGFA